jgi:G:T-mismatch repair DNA endonuclease (very short patch repair protein)
VSQPCWNDRGYCILIEHWEGCWKHGHEEPDKSKCPKTAKAVDAIWSKICDRHIERCRRNARRASVSGQGADE